MDHELKCKLQNFQIKNRRKSSWPEVRQRALRLDKKKHGPKKKMWIQWTSSKVKNFLL